MSLIALFLRASGLIPVPVEKVFPPGAVINVTEAPYRAVPDDGQDDTAALQRAITENLESGRVLYLPAGVYEVSATLRSLGPDGHWKPRVTLQGQHRDRTIIRLRDGAPGFGNPRVPASVYESGSLWQPGDSPGGGGNKAFSNNVLDLTIDTGRGNPGAIGIEWANSNQGTIADVRVLSADGQGVAGISMARAIPGPGFLTRVEVRGYDYGIRVEDVQYGFTLENVWLEGQGKAGLYMKDNLAHVRRLYSRNRVPAVEVRGDSAVLTLVESDLRGGDPARPAIECEGALYLRQVESEGYKQTVEPGRERQWIVPAESTVIPEAPNYFYADLSDWEPVGERRPGEPDDTGAIQRALDSGKGTVYFRNTRVYFLSETLVARGKVRRILGLGTELNLGAAKEPFSNREQPRPLLRVDPAEADTIYIEDFLFNAQYPGEVLVEHNSPRTVVIRRCLGWVGAEGFRRSYRNTPAAAGARVFLEDVFLPGWEFRGVEVWARQFNPENSDGDGSLPQVLSADSRLWILGFKTEGPAPFLVSRGPAARTVLLGAYNYVSAASPQPLPAGSVPYSLEEGASAELFFTTENFREGHDDYATYLRADGVNLRGADLPARWDGRNPKSRVMYYQNAGSARSRK